MKFLQDMISRKRHAQTATDEDLADPMPLHEIRHADKAAVPQADDAEPDQDALSADARSVLEDDGDYDWDLSEIEPFETEEEAEMAASELEETLGKTAAGEAVGDTVDHAETAAGDAVLAENEDAQVEEEQDMQSDDDEAFEVADVMAALKVETPVMAEDEPEEMEEAAAPKSFDEWHAQAATAAPAAAKPATGQQAMLAMIRAARERAEQTRIAEEAGESAAPVARPVPQIVPVAEPEPVAEAEPEIVEEEIEAFEEEADFDEVSEPVAEDEGAVADDDDFEDDDDLEDMAEFDDEPAVAAEAEAEPELEPEQEPEPVQAPLQRKIWDIHGDDDDAQDHLAVNVDQIDEPDADDEALAASARSSRADERLSRLIGDTVAEGPESDPDDVPAALAPMTAPKRRAGRVKTRLLGFNKADAAEVDPIKAAAASTQSGSPSFPVGWMIVVKGPGRGACFTLGAGASKIGRGEDQPVRLNFGDTSISRDNHAVVAYDDEQRKFFLGHGGKANLVRLNDMPVLATEPLADADLIRIGETTLRFVALCGPEFSWEDEADQASEWHGAAQ